MILNTNFYKLKRVTSRIIKLDEILIIIFDFLQKWLTSSHFLTIKL